MKKQFSTGMYLPNLQILKASLICLSFDLSTQLKKINSQHIFPNNPEEIHQQKKNLQVY